MTHIALLLFVALMFLCSAFFSGVETGVYRMSRFRLRLGTEQRWAFYRQLSEAVADGQGLILSLLLGNNLVNYLATSCMTWWLLSYLQDENLVEFYTTTIMTPSLFIFGEILPKSVFFYRADSLMRPLAPAIWSVWRICTVSGVVKLMRFLFKVFSRLFRIPVDTAAAVDITQRSQVRQIIQETRDEGLLTSLQKNMMQRLINIPEVSVGTVVVPMNKAEMAEVNSNRKALLAIVARCPHRRIPVYEKDRNNIIGFIDIYQTLGSTVEFETLRAFLQPIVQMDMSISVLDAISIMRKGTHRIAIITTTQSGLLTDQKKPLGVLTLKDLVEELTGELARYELTPDKTKTSGQKSTS
ncbi:MAG: CNNM domain-containing protein [Anaerohalosphaeraceae bacterium]